MNNQDDSTTGSGDPDAIYRAPESDTKFVPQDDLLATFIGPKNTAYYTRRFAGFESGSGAVSWHWPAFFVTSFWLLYRKMWLLALGYWIVLPVVLSLLSVAIAAAGGGAASVLFYYGSYFLIAFILAPIFANRLYYRHALGKIDKAGDVTTSSEQHALEVARRGGTSNIVLVILPIVLVAVAGILAAIAIPAYQDYTIRAQVSEGLALSGGAKAAVANYYDATGELAADNETAGLVRPEEITGNYVSAVAVEDGTITIYYGKEAHMMINGETIELQPGQDSTGNLLWTCSSPSIRNMHLPAACR